MRILVAEDERITRMTLCRQLQSWGHVVTAAEDGLDAFDKFSAGEFDIIITDWEMPRMSGVELVEQIRKAHRPIYTYVIILTSRSDKADVVDGKALTSYASLQTDVRNAGGSWVDEEVVTDDTDGWTLVTSRTPDDLDAFLREVDNALLARPD